MLSSTANVKFDITISENDICHWPWSAVLNSCPRNNLSKWWFSPEFSNGTPVIFEQLKCDLAIDNNLGNFNVL